MPVALGDFTPNPEFYLEDAWSDEAFLKDPCCEHPFSRK